MYGHDAAHTFRSNRGGASISGTGVWLRWIFSIGAPVTAGISIGANNTIFVGSTNSRFYAIHAPIGTTSSAPTVRWTAQTGDAISGATAAVSADHMVYVGAFNTFLYALDVRDGTLRWQYNVSGSPKSPAVAEDGTVLWSTGFDGMLALNGTNGALKWRNSSMVYSTGLALGPDDTIYEMGYGALIARNRSGLQKYSGRCIVARVAVVI